MDRNALIPVLGAAILNGIFSPWLIAVYILYPIWYPDWMPQYAQIVYMLSSLIMSTLTVMVSGIPAALYERFAAQPRPMVTTVIWVVGAVILTLPAIPQALLALSAS